MSISIKVKFLGVLEKVFHTKERVITVDREECTLGEFLRLLREEARGDLTFDELFDLHSRPKRSLLVLVNGATYEAVGGLELALKDGDEVVLLPTIHGGLLLCCRD